MRQHVGGAAGARAWRSAALGALVDARFDVVVVGGGVVGVFAAWDAALRGLTVALVEREDFGSGTSSNCLKIAHGGLRYLQRADLARVRASVHERAVLLHAAPHLVRPLPCVMPTAGAGLRSAPVLWLALRMNDIASRHRLTSNGSAPRPPVGRTLGRAEFRRLAGEFAPPAATGGALWGDALIESPERVLMGAARAGREAGAVMLNHAEATTLLERGGNVQGVLVRAPEGDIEVRARCVLNAAGPWAMHSLSRLRPAPDVPLVLGFNVVVARQGGEAAVAVPHPDGRRMLFAVPWRGHLMLGTGYVESRDGATHSSPAEADIAALLRAFNTALPALELRGHEVTLVHSGLLPAWPGRHDTPAAALRDRAVLVDHGDAGGPAGLVTAAAEKWTTARRTAERGVDMVQRRLGQEPRAGGTDRRHVAGGDIANVTAFLDTPLPGGGSASVPGEWVRRLRSLHGTRWTEVAALAEAEPALARPLGGGPALAAEVAFAVRSEMALHLTDVVLRRTELGTAGRPGEDVLSDAADVAAAELGWNEEHRAEEMRAVQRRYPAHSRPTR